MPRPVRLVGVGLQPERFTALVAKAGDIAETMISVPPTVCQRDGALLVGDAADRRARSLCAGSRSDVLDRFGDRAFVALWDTYFPPDHLVGMLLAAIRRNAEQVADGPLDITSIAYPVAWDLRRRHLIERVAHAAGLTGVRVMTAPEAAAWAPVPGQAPGIGGLLLMFDLASAGSISLLEPASTGYRLVEYAPLSGASSPGAAARGLLKSTGRSMGELREVRAIGAGAGEHARISPIAREFGGLLRVPAAPSAAVTIGAVHRWLGVPQPPRPTWIAVVRADRSRFDEVRRLNGPDAADLEFPRECPERRFVLSGPRVAIGRRSRARGTNPEIDLSEPPLDPGVSAQHAELLSRPDGGWELVDLDSTNGTWVGDSPTPIAPDIPVVLADGDRIKLGMWTTITVGFEDQAH